MIKIGDNDTKLYLGTTEIEKVYLGANQVFDGGGDEPQEGDLRYVPSEEEICDGCGLYQALEEEEYINDLWVSTGAYQADYNNPIDLQSESCGWWEEYGVCRQDYGTGCIAWDETTGECLEYEEDCDPCDEGGNCYDPCVAGSVCYDPCYCDGDCPEECDHCDTEGECYDPCECDPCSDPSCDGYYENGCDEGGDEPEPEEEPEE